QVASPTLYGVANFPLTMTNTAVSTTTNIIPLTKNCCVALEGVFNASTGTGNVQVTGSFSADGTNFGLAPFTLNTAANGTTKVVTGTNFSQAFLSGYSAMNITTITNGTGGVLTNFEWVVSRPTLNTATY
ncbi:MAG: hypothetical protein KGL39_59200, partial [Patescibacteria group bacterium]|nr:hypothetical protein [Patescibacteria group bacterium]